MTPGTGAGACAGATSPRESTAASAGSPRARPQHPELARGSPTPWRGSTSPRKRGTPPPPALPAGGGADSKRPRLDPPQPSARHAPAGAGGTASPLPPERSASQGAGQGALQPGTPLPGMRPPLPPSLRDRGGNPRSSAPRPRARGRSRPYLRVGEIVEEEGGELFVQQRAAVVPRHLPAAAAACGGVSAEPAGGRERAGDGGRREEGAREAEGGAQAAAAAGPAGCGGGAARGRCPPGGGRAPAFLLQVWSRDPSRQPPPAPRTAADGAPSLQPGFCAAMRAAPRFCQSESRCLGAGRVRLNNLLLHGWGN